MSVPRRRLIRPALAPAPDPNRPRKIQKLRERLDHERTALVRWQSKLKRAFNSVERYQRSVSRVEHKITQLENQA
jgi:hypothetical protein